MKPKLDLTVHLFVHEDCEEDNLRKIESLITKVKHEQHKVERAVLEHQPLLTPLTQ